MRCKTFFFDLLAICAILAASGSEHAHAAIILTDASNITLNASQLESGATTSDNPDVTGGAGGLLQLYAASGATTGGAAFTLANLNDGDVGIGNPSDGTYAIVLTSSDLRLTFAGAVNLGGIAIYDGYVNRDDGSYTLLDDSGVTLGAWDITTTTGSGNDVDSFWLTFNAPVTTSFLTLRAASTDFGNTVSYREIQVFAAATNPIPESTTLAIWSLLGGIGLVVGQRRRRRNAA